MSAQRLFNTYRTQGRAAAERLISNAYDAGLTSDDEDAELRGLLYSIAAEG